MIAVLVLVTGVLVILVVGAVGFLCMGMESILPSLVPLAPWLVMAGTILLMLTEIPLLFGSKDDRRSAIRDFGYLLPTCLVSLVLFCGLEHYLW